MSQKKDLYLHEVPRYSSKEFFGKKNKYCVCIPIINEGEKIKKQLDKMHKLGLFNIADIIICDGGSTDGSMEENYLISKSVRALLTKQGKGKLSAQLRMGYNYCLEQNYEGVITVDGSNKDGVEAIKNFVEYLDKGYDYIQGSRFIEGGKAINTPLSRYYAVKFIHAPFVSLCARFRYTDTTNGFRGYSRKLLEDKNISIFRNVFDTYELLPYIAVKAPKLKYRVVEIPVIRQYPASGKIPTKISPVRGNLLLLKILLFLALGKYEPK